MNTGHGGSRLGYQGNVQRADTLPGLHPKHLPQRHHALETKTMKSACIYALLALTLGGCATSSTIQPAASSKSQFDGAVYAGETAVISADGSVGEEYRVFQQGATGFVSVGSVRDDAEQRMKDFCDRKSKAAKPLRERTSVPPHILGNYPRIEIIFACVDHPATAVQGVVQDPKFVKLTNLKKLLDDRVITQQEFDAEKAKVLAQP